MRIFFIIFFLLLLSVHVVAGEVYKVQYVETEGVIRHVKSSFRDDSSYTKMWVSYQVNGKEMEGEVQVFSMPIIGTLKKAGDHMRVFYEKDNPSQLRTIEGTFAERYGIYILIILIILFAVLAIRRLNEAYNRSGQSNF